MKKLLILFLIFGFLFADISPIPENQEPPNITITLMDNGAPYSGYMALNYYCTELTPEYTLYSNDTSPTDERTVEFACTEGSCTNTYWFYKFNPCFSGAEGYFTYEFLGEEKTSETIIFVMDKSYDLSLDLPSGVLSNTTNGGENENKEEEKPNQLCPVSLLLLAIPFLGIKHVL